MAEPEATGPDDPPRRSAALPVAITLAAVFGVTSVLLAVVAVGLKSDKDDVLGDQRDVEQAAGAFVQAFADYDQGVESIRDDVLPLAAEPFTAQFTRAAEQIADLNESLGRVSSRATITEVHSSATQGDQASAIVVYDSVETYADGTTVTGQNIYLRLGLVRLDGEWRVNDVINLNFAFAGEGAGAGGATTGTSATTTPSG